ncbi:MAG: hypothetical protein IJ404_04490 [Clostridia bacterium]|nr:hypothetical protein [Clostridia bacterium]
MKKIIILLLTASMIAAAFMGCSDKPDSEKQNSEKLPSDGFGLTSEDTNGNKLRDDVELKILKHVYGKKVDPDDTRLTYYTTYHNAIVLSVYIIKPNSIYVEDILTETVAGFEFTFDARNRPKIWYVDKLYELKDAYELGIVTVDDLENLSKRICGEPVIYGIYNGATVCEMWGNAYLDIKNDQTIEGFVFRFSEGMNIKVFHNDKLYGLKEAYELGILTIDDIKDIHAKHLNG